MDTRGKGATAATDDDVARFVERTGGGGEPDSYSGKRQSTRFSEGVTLNVTPDPAMPSATMTVYMHNVSQGGFAFWSKRRMFPRTTVFVREYTGDDAQPWLRAHVTHCTVGIRGFLIGAAFDDATPAA